MSDPAFAPFSSATPVRSRLDRALIDFLRTISAEELDSVSVEAVAQAAGVSRATAYRHFGDREGLLFHAAMELTRRHAEVVADLVAGLPTLAAKVEEALAYMAAQIKVDRMLHMLLTSHRSPEIGRALHQLSQQIMGPAYQAAQRDGQIRNDVSVDELLRWIAEQRQVMIGLRLSEADARVWVRAFVLPALRPQGPSTASGPELRAVLADLDDRVAALGAVVRRTRATFY
jgi:AcrR family transcriptional regulator